MRENLTILEKLYEFTLYMYPVIAKYPKFEKFTLQTRTKDTIFDLMDCIEKTNKSTSKKSGMYDADMLLSRLRRYIRLAKDLHYINMHQYGVISGMLSEIGKLLGGWIKWAKG